MLAFGGFSLFPAEAHASVFSFVSNLFKQDKLEAAVIESNSQKLKILEAPLAANPSIGGAEVVIVDDSALDSQDDFVDGDVVQPQSGQISVYVVRPGDTLSQIAAMFNVSINTIVWANDLHGRVISPGQTLIILPVSGIKYTVKKGDTLASVAKKYKADAQEIIDFNNLEEGTKLAVGDEIIIPDAVAEAAPASKNSSGSSIKPGAFANLPSTSGYYTRPVVNARRTQGIHGYNGVDLGAPLGTPVLAAASGKVIISRASGWNGGYGNYIVIYHDNGTQTLYAHLSRNSVVQGQTVDKGQIIGAVGTTGKSTGTHLHFEVRGAKNPF